LASSDCTTEICRGVSGTLCYAELRKHNACEASSQRTNQRRQAKKQSKAKQSKEEGTEEAPTKKDRGDDPHFLSEILTKKDIMEIITG
jgi:hypothetical protein